jgi:hypothetical protein
VKNVGEPCAGEPHARFDGGREETGTSRRTSRGARRLPPTRPAPIPASVSGCAAEPRESRSRGASLRITSPSRFCLQAIAAPSTRCASGGRLVSMMRLLRLALQVVLFFLLLSLVVAVAAAETGFVEKVALITAGVVLVWLASRVRRIGASPAHHT